MRRTTNDPLFSSFSFPSTNAKSSGSTPLTAKALGCMLLLALQFGFQPSLTRQCIPSTCNTSACRSSVVLVQEVIKFGIASTMLIISGQWSKALSGWSIQTCIAVAGVPSALYCVQNMAALLAYQNLDPLTFNVLNQTKTLSAALCCYIVMGRRQSRVQLLSLFTLLLSALIIEGILTLDMLFPFFGIESLEQHVEGPEKTTLRSITSGRHFTHGVAPVFLASFLSGLAGALSQKNLQGASGCGKTGRNSYLFSMELCSASMVILVGSLILSEDGATLRKNGFFDQWNLKMFIPICTNAAGGVIVGLVTKYAGSVRKGFALVFGMFLSGIVQARTEDSEGAGVGKEHVLGGTIAAISLLMHCTHPYTPATPSDVIAATKTSDEARLKRASRKARKED